MEPTIADAAKTRLRLSVLEDAVVLQSGQILSVMRIVAGDRILATMNDVGSATRAIANLLASSQDLLVACRAAYFELPHESAAAVTVKAAIERAENGRVL